MVRYIKCNTTFHKNSLGLKDKYDFVFIDVGPSLGVLNRLVLLFTDGFIMPTSSDIFCLRAVDNISKAIEQWIQTFKKLQEKYYDNISIC